MRMRIVTSLSFLLLAVAVGFSQDTRQGLPYFGSFDRTNFDVVNRQNLNTHISIPIASIPGRGFPFQLALNYDSILWTKSGSTWTPAVNANGLPTWGWGSMTSAGKISYKQSSWKCGTTWGISRSQYSYVDAKGTAHAFSQIFITQCPAISPNWDTTSTYADDGSGYLTVIGTDGVAHVKSPSAVSATAAQVSDTNGNSVASTTANNITTWTDTRGNSAIKIDTSVAGTNKYEVIDQNGGNSTIYTLTYSQFNIKTNFGCGGVSEYTSSSAVWLPTSLTLPDNLSYTFTYETNSSYPSYKTGRLASMTTPAGATYSYSYSGSNGGVNCSDGTYTSMTRQITSDGNTSTWNFARTANGSNWNTAVTYPVMPFDSTANQDVFAFDSANHETSRSSYQGSSSLIQTLTTTWSTDKTAPIQITTTLPSGWHKDISETWYYGSVASLKEFDWTNGAGLGTQLRDTEISYLSQTNSNYLTANLLGLVATRKVFDGVSVLRSSTAYTYDEVGKVTNCPTGVVGHDDTNYGCSNGGTGSSSTYPRGLITTVNQYTNVTTNPGTAPVTTGYTYDVFGNALTATVSGALQATAVYSSTTKYSAPDSITLGSGTTTLTTSHTYNQYTGMATGMTDPNGGGSSQTYDAMLRPLVTTRPDTKTVSVSYDDVNRTVTTVTPFQGTASLTAVSFADQLGRVYKSQTPTGTVQTVFDPLGRTYQVSNPFANGSSASYWTTMKYDAIGRQLSVTTPDNVTSSNSFGSESANPYFVVTTDGAGKQKKYSYDGTGHLTNSYEPDLTQQTLPLTVQTTYTYSGLDSLLTVTQGTQTRTFAYDGLNRITSATTPEAGTVSYSYDNCSQSPSNVCFRTDARGAVTNYTYDALNRPYQVSYNVGTTGVPATPTVTYSYGTAAPNLGRMTGVTDGTHTDTYAYDIMGNVLSVSQSVAGQTYAIQSVPNYAGLPTQLTYPSGMYLSYAYDGNGNLSSITDNNGKQIASGISYNPAGQVTGYAMGLTGGTVNASFGYSAQRLQLGTLNYNVGGTNTIFSLSYGYSQNTGNNGQITSITDNLQSGRSGTFGYDALNRLTSYQTVGSASYPQQTMSWSFDRYGNRTAQVLNGNPLSLSPDPSTNRLLGYSYDANGNLSNDGTYALSWDAENRMVSYAAGSVTNEYDGNSMRVRRTGPQGGDVAYVFAGAQPIAEYAAGGAANSPSVEYVYLGGQLIASKSAGVYTFYERDQLSIRGVLSDANPLSPTEQGHLPFGEAWYGSGNKWRFTSYERDSDVGDDFAVFRRYQYGKGRFSSPDPVFGNVGDPQTWNRYSYVTNNPVSWVDPLGHHKAFPGQCDSYAMDCGGSGEAGDGTDFAINGISVSSSTFWSFFGSDLGDLGNLMRYAFKPVIVPAGVVDHSIIADYQQQVEMGVTFDGPVVEFPNTGVLDLYWQLPPQGLINSAASSTAYKSNSPVPQPQKKSYWSCVAHTTFVDAAWGAGGTAVVAIVVPTVGFAIAGSSLGPEGTVAGGGLGFAIGVGLAPEAAAGSLSLGVPIGMFHGLVECAF